MVESPSTGLAFRIIFFGRSCSRRVVNIGSNWGGWFFPE